MKVTGTYIWSVKLEVDIPEGATDRQQKEALEQSLMKARDKTTGPTLVKCSNPNLVE